MDYKKNKNVVAGVWRLNFPVVNKSLTAKFRKVEIELAATINHLSETMKKYGKKRKIFKVIVTDKFDIHLLYF